METTSNDTIIFKNSLRQRKYKPRPVYEFRLKALAPLIKDQIHRYNLSIDDIALALGMSHKQVQGHLRGSNGLKSPEQYEKVMKLCLEAKAQGVSVLDMMTTPGETPTGNRRKLPAYKPEAIEESVGTPVPVQTVEVPTLDWMLGTCLTFLGGVVGAFLSQVFL